MSSILKIENLSLNYGKLKALDNVSLELELGNFVGLLGPNGSGKSSLLRILAGLEYNYEGKVEIDQIKPGKHTKLLTSYSPDMNCFPPSLTVDKAFGYYHKFFSDFNAQRADALMSKLGLDRQQQIHELSKGMLERLYVALTMSRSASIFLLDEPLSGVDPATRSAILETVIKNYSTNTLIIISTHMLEDLESYFDEVVILNNGQLYEHDGAEALRERYQKSINHILRDMPYGKRAL